MALINKLGAIGDAIREKTGGTELLTLDAMPAKILSIETGGGGGGADLPEEAFTLTGDCQYRFANSGWNWFLEQYGNKIITKNITYGSYMFYNIDKIENIPFEINLQTNKNTSVTSIFERCNALKEIPKIVGMVGDTRNMFNNCVNLRELKEETIAGIDWSWVDNLTSSYSGNRSNTFNGCYSLRKYPNSFLAHGNPSAAYSMAIYYYLFSYCYSLDEVVDLPIIHGSVKWTSNAFNNTFNNCSRLKRITFETNEDGSPIVMNNWSKQSIYLATYVGYISNYTYNLLNYNSGITEATQVTDDASYQALKNNPDWWTTNINYARYNHDSAVETINTLPDLSGGAGGNTIKFTGAAGALTDGGAINTMTEEEIAVAAAKGWTVTFV